MRPGWEEPGVERTRVSFKTADLEAVDEVSPKGQVGNVE